MRRLKIYCIIRNFILQLYYYKNGGGVQYMTIPKRKTFLKFLFKKWYNVDKLVSTKESDDAGRILLDYYIFFVQNHPDLILVFSLDGEIVSYNKRNINKFLGFRPRQNVSYKNLISNKQYQLLTAAFNTAKNGKSERVQFDILNKHNEQLHLIGTFIPIETTGKRIEAVSLILKDITNKKKLEQKNQITQ